MSRTIVPKTHTRQYSNGSECAYSAGAALLWQRVEEVFNRHFDVPDMQAVRAVFACFAAHGLTGQPCCPILIGPPGSLKTVLLNGLDGLPDTHIIDQITPRTFISGYKSESFKEEKPAGLLFRISPSSKIVIPDFSTILAINRDDRASILSDFRRIYDGMLRKEFGTGHDMSVREWRGRITFLAAGTGDVDRHYSVFASLGERFLLIRWPRAGREAAMRAIRQDMKVVQQDLVEAVHPLLTGLEGNDSAIPPELEYQIPALGDFISYCRTPVVRDSRGSREIIDVPEAESATRISQQLCQLAKGSTLLDRRSVVNETDWELVKRVAFDCMPPARRKVLQPLIDAKEASVRPQGCRVGTSRAEQTTTSDAMPLPESTRRYAIQELVALGVLTEEHRLSERSQEQLTLAGLI